MRIVYVTNLKSGTLTRQTARSQGRQTTFMRNLSQRVCLVHKLRQSIRSEERVDNRRNCLRVNQIDRGKHFIIANVHTFTNRTGHTGQTNTELIIQLLANCTHTTVAQVVDIINNRLRVDQLDQILDDLDYIFFRQNLNIIAGSKVQLLINSVTAYFT